MLETINDGKPTTPFLKFGDVVTIEMKNEDGCSLFGQIKQKVTKKNIEE
jgi:fumarylacetoacetate (FAA) hydrolase